MAVGSVLSMSRSSRRSAGCRAGLGANWLAGILAGTVLCVWSLAEVPLASAQGALDSERMHAVDRIRQAPLEADGFAELAAVLFRSGDSAHAVAAAEEAARLEPGAARHHRLLGYLRAGDGLGTGAETAFRRAGELEPTMGAPLADFRLAQAWAGYQNALRLGTTDPAIAERVRGLAALADLSPELQLLLRAPDSTAEPAAADVVPPIVLSDEAPHALVVDKRTQTARLYGRRGADEVVLLQTFPCTTGQAPGGKSRRGDRRTPDGAYVISDVLTGEELPGAYGALALPLNYPNAWDRREHRGGDGIWLHGSDRLGAPFAPRETRGCVLLRNDDLRALARLVTPEATPVLIAEDIAYLPAAAWRARAHDLLEPFAAEHVLAMVAAPDYFVVVRRDGSSVVRDFVRPDAPSRVVVSERAQPIAAEAWRQKLAGLAPQATAALLSVRVLDPPTAVVIETSSPAAVRDFRPEFADRLYLDLPGVRPGPVPAVVPGSGPWIKEVRVAPAALDPPSTRLMIGLTQAVDYRIVHDGNRIVVSFGAR